ncbi:hypothetical protein LEN26_006967 [Aphanomyces euteiches]|nr:hypothetical protein AeMF1_020009 [Aphanomyces euteiches]KAH9133853.1 hypothetical protein LEN26_006967 [Aphanomyces euteiches]KAH9189571.1 hypothetical protein AeNC1_008456 [Aphanomyces euteiches]
MEVWTTELAGWTGLQGAIAAVVVLLSYVVFFIPKSSSSSKDGKRLKRRMSGLGLTTILTETETNLSILFSVLTFERIVPRDVIVERFRERMVGDFFFRFRSTVVGNDFVLDPNFDPAKNISTYKLRDGETMLLRAQSLYNAPLDKNKPLWDMELVEEGGKTHVLLRTHHCLGDGASVWKVYMTVFDMDQKLEIPSIPKGPKPSLFSQIAYIAWSIYVYVIKLAKLFLTNESTAYFKQPGSPSKRLAFSSTLKVDETKVIGKAIGASINDVMLSAVAGGLFDILPPEEKKRAENGGFLRTAIPIDMRHPAAPWPTTNNRFSSLMINLPIGVSDRIQRTKAIVKSMGVAKTSLEKIFTMFINRLSWPMPKPIMVAITHSFTQRISVAVTNVRGPPVRFSLGDIKLEMFRGFIPPPPSVNVGIAITSFANELFFSVATDKSIDATKLKSAIEAEYRAMQAATAKSN